jgi:tetratricopeptide (TPR) repeat protein
MLGKLVAGRFRVERRVGSGGMGTVYFATDELSKTSVALKVLHAGVPEGESRFTREVSALARMSHPGIVRYVAHGDAWVAMEWLEGEDLAHRLRMGPLPVDEAVDLVARLADALEYAHTLGIVHRDIKPSNLVFEKGEASRVRIVDFGLAWIEGEDGFRSTTGMILGTPGYMAPEQARGNTVDARADVFALACVLYKCLTGRGPFSGPDAVATLAKLLLDEPEPVSSLRPEAPRALDELLARAMAKDPALRPQSASAFASELRELDSGINMRMPSVDSSAVLTDRERRIVSVVVAAREGLGENVSTIRCEVDPLLVERETAIRDVARLHGARLEILPVAIIAVLSEGGSATDAAAAAARLSIALHDVLAGVPIALATGRAEIGLRSMGDVIDRAVARITSKGSRSAESGVWLDETTAGLLGPAFIVRGTAAGIELVGERPTDMRVRTLLGKPTPCVGRDRDLAFLDATLAECQSDDVARCVLVTAPAGVGKSRLRYEWLRKLAERGVEVWSARADPMTIGAPFSLLAQLVRRAAGIDPAEPADAARSRLRARVSRHVQDDATVQRIAEFLGEAIGTRFPDEGRVQLRAAKQDAQLMGDQIRRAWEDWVGAEASAGSVVIVLEDLHWGDLPTVKLIDYALAAHTGLPLLVLALARPEVKEAFPSLWQGRGLLELPLAELTPKAAARLARHVLGEGVPPETIDRAVARSAGNAFFLEEILRAVAEGRGDDVPESVLAMVQRRLDALEPEPRRLLRAASVFGETFWRGAVLTQVDAASSVTSRVDAWLSELARRELVTLRDASRFAGEQELTFRHALVREAAYAMLTDDDRVLAHRLAGTWLEERGESDSAVLAGHFDRGGDATRAVHHYALAAPQALEGNDLSRVLEHVDRGVALGAAGAVLGDMRRIQAEVLRWRGRIAEAETAAREATTLLPHATPSWYTAVSELATCAGALAHVDGLLGARTTLLAYGNDADIGFPIAVGRVVMQLYAVGERALADETMERIDAFDVARAEPIASARVEQARAFRALYSSDHGTYYERMKSCRALFDLAGDRRNACVTAVNMGYVVIAVGALDEAEETLVSMLRVAEMLGIVRIRAVFQQNIGLLRHLQGRYEEAIFLNRQAAATFAEQGDRRLLTFSRIYLSMALAQSGDVDSAFIEAELALEASKPILPAHASALANLADLELRFGRQPSALAHASEAYAIMEQLGGIEDTESLVRLVYGEALAASGRDDDARVVVRRAIELITARTENIAIGRWRDSFTRTPDNQRTFALGARLGV